MNIVIENLIQAKEEFRWYEDAIKYIMDLTLLYLRKKQIEIPNGEIKAVIRDYLNVEFSFQSVPQDFQQQFLNVLAGYRTL